MKRISVTPLKTVNGVDFGTRRAGVRKEFGSFKEFKKGKDSKVTTDDFRWCHVYYDKDHKMIAVEVFPDECHIAIDGKSVDVSSKKTCLKTLGMDGDIDKKRSIAVFMSDGKVGAIMFGRKGYFDEETPKKPPEQKTDVQKESFEDASGASGGNSIRGDSLTQFYDDLKSQLDRSDRRDDGCDHEHEHDHHSHDHKHHGHHNHQAHHIPALMSVGRSGPGMMHPGAMMWRQNAIKQADQLTNNCHRQILVDIYCKILPLDQPYIDGHMGQMKNDVDSMLQAKNMTPTQYLTSCYESTKAPLLDYLLRAGKAIGQQFLMEADETLKDAQDEDVKIPSPKAPSVDSEEIAGQLVDVKNDTEYETFVDKLKQKTVNKIVADVSKIISDKKEEKQMTFDTSSPAEQEAATESTTSVSLDYLQRHLITESVEVDPDMQDEMMGMAIRESTLHQLDVVFNQPHSDYRSFESRIRYNHGYVVNESAVQAFTESKH